MPRSPRLFTKIDEHIQLLEEISLEKCSWFETHDLVVFSKLPHLKRLILRGCNSLKGCVPYGSIATRFGFKSLEVNKTYAFYRFCKNNKIKLTFSVFGCA